MLLTMGCWKIPLIVYSVVPAVDRKGIMYLAAQLSLPVCSLRDRRRRSVFKFLVVWMAYHAGQFGDRARGMDGGVFVWGAAG